MIMIYGLIIAFIICLITDFFADKLNEYGRDVVLCIALLLILLSVSLQTFLLLN